MTKMSSSYFVTAMLLGLAKKKFEQLTARYFCLNQMTIILYNWQINGTNLPLKVEQSQANAKYARFIWCLRTQFWSTQDLGSLREKYLNTRFCWFKYRKIRTRKKIGFWTLFTQRFLLISKMLDYCKTFSLLFMIVVFIC